MASQEPLPIVLDQQPGLWRLGNKLFQVAFGRYVAGHLDRPTMICGADLPPFRAHLPPRSAPPLRRPLVLGVAECNQVDLSWVGPALEAGDHDGIVVTGWGTTLASVRGSRDLFTTMLDDLSLAVPAFDDRVAVISLRLGDIQRDPPVHPDYSPLPVEFYAKVVDDLQCQPVFVGQLTNGPYVDGLRRRFPGARFLQPGVLEAFSLVRLARVKVGAVSTFSWLAAWLGGDHTRVIQPVAGALNPMQRPDWDLLPWTDPRYEFRWLAPARRSPDVPLDRHLRAWHRASEGYPTITSDSLAPEGTVRLALGVPPPPASGAGAMDSAAEHGMGRAVRSDDPG